VHIHAQALLNHHFEVADGLQTVREHVKLLCDAAIDYFLGPWRAEGCESLDLGRVTSDEARGNQWWFEKYRAGMLAAALLQDEAAAARLSTWIGPDLQWYDEIVGMPKPEFDWHWHLAAWRCGESVDAVSRKLDELGTARLKRQRFLGLATQALIRDDGDAFRAWMDKLGEALLQQDYQKVHDYRLPNYEASILWHTARARGLPLPDLNARVRKVPKFKIKRPGFVSPTLDATAADFIFFPDGIDGR
jgi:hypothetical protein